MTTELKKEVKEVHSGFPWGLVASASLFAFALAALVSLVTSFVMKPDFAKKIKLKNNLAIEGDLNIVEESISFADTKKIITRNIFNKEGKVPEDDGKKNKKSGYEIATTLPLKLLGVIHGGAKFNGVAIIKDNRKPDPGSFIVGDEVPVKKVETVLV